MSFARPVLPASLAHNTVNGSLVVIFAIVDSGLSAGRLLAALCELTWRAGRR